jgi:hypothetical protein
MTTSDAASSLCQALHAGYFLDDENLKIKLDQPGDGVDDFDYDTFPFQVGTGQCKLPSLLHFGQ